MNTLDLDKQLNDMIVAGQSVDALRKFYDENVVPQEVGEPERSGGLKAWIEARTQMESATKRFSAKVLSHAANGDVSFSEWEYDLDITGMGAIKLSQVAVRRWRNGKVVHERFYHK